MPAWLLSRTALTVLLVAAVLAYVKIQHAELRAARAELEAKSASYTALERELATAKGANDKMREQLAQQNAQVRDLVRQRDDLNAAAAARARVQQRKTEERRKAVAATAIQTPAEATEWLRAQVAP